MGSETTSEEIELLKEIGRMRAINRFYRTCYAVLQENRQLVAEISSALILLSRAQHSNSQGNSSLILELSRKLKHTAERAENLEKAALNALEDVEITK